MSTFGEINHWLYERVAEIEQRNSDPSDPQAEDVRQLALSLRYAMEGAQQIAKLFPQAAEVLVKYAARPFAEYAGYDPGWTP